MSEFLGGMFDETLDALDELIPGDKTVREMIEAENRDDYRIIEYHGELFELVPVKPVRVNEYTEAQETIKADRDKWARKYQEAVREIAALKSKAEMYQEKAEQQAARVKHLEAETDRIGSEAERLSKAYARTRKQLNKQAVGGVENA